MCKYFDAHIHLNSPLLFKFLNKNYHDWVFNNIGTDLQDSQLSCDQSTQYQNIFSTVGIHPLSIREKTWQETEKKLEHIIQKNHIIAIGESGLDFFRSTNPLEHKQQLEWLHHHYQLAKKYNLPLILHVREAHDCMIKFLKAHPWFGIIHSFDGEQEHLQQYLGLENWMISISPLIFRKPNRFKHFLTLIPDNKLLVETDAPWLTKTPEGLLAVIDMVAEFKNITHLELKRMVWENGTRLLNLDSKQNSNSSNVMKNTH